MFSFILYFRLLIFIMGFSLGLAVCLEMGGQGGSFNNGGFIIGGLMGVALAGFIYCLFIYIFIYFTSAFVMFIVYIYS